ncbi:protein RKD5 isoform X2 [Mangifera indica]|uniref:protein RKD5 isoform X2 n=1 Tax=Mangifera indica TaxID=29780 RepID=UPI001CF9831D|nr:protein RKD5 isoform X2 [Mangifera indica]
MDSAQQSSISALFVFENTINKELIRSLHVYRLENGKERQVEREFLFRKKGSYVEMAATPLLRLRGFQVSELFEGRVIGLWFCLFAFHADSSPSSTNIPPVLLISRNPKLKSIPELSSDLQIIYELSIKSGDQELSHFKWQAMDETNQEHCHLSRRSPHEFDQDLNSLPNSVTTSEHSGIQETEECASGIVGKKKRAASEDIARIALEDLAKYFDLPILEASRNLKVGLTVLKKKCREFGIPRWPHRKIKSLDGLIHELQEVGQQQQEDEAAATAVAKRRQMLEEEKETIERKPFMEIQTETKKFRQDIFKRRHKARVLKKQD